MKITKCFTAVIATALTLAGSPATQVRAMPAVDAHGINVQDFGAKGDGVTDDTDALNAAIVAGKRLGAGAVVKVPRGRYRTALGKTKSVVVHDADHLTLQGEAGTVIVSSDLDSPVFNISNCDNLNVKSLTVDHDPLGYTQGTIDSVDIPEMTCEVTIDPGYPAPNSPTLKGPGVHTFVFPKQGYYQLDRYWPKPVHMNKTGPNSWHWVLEGPPTIENWTGKKFFIKTESRSHAFELRKLRDCSFEDINYWGGGANAGFYINGLEGTTTFRRFMIGVPPGSGRLYCSDGGGQISGLRGKLIFDHCDFSKIDDDGIDILSTWTRIEEQQDKRTLLVQQKSGDYRPGDQVEIWDWVHKKMRSTAVITSASRKSDGSYLICLDRDVVTERVGAGSGPGFSKAAMMDGLDRIIDLSTVGQETLITDCNFQVFRAKCLNLKAAHCTVVRCSFRNSFQPAISAAPEWFFEEGPTIRNLVVRDCNFTDCNHFNIDIGAASLTGVPTADPKDEQSVENQSHDSSDILIEGNSFTGYGTVPSVFSWNWPVGPALHITNAAHVMIRHNKFGPLSTLAPKGTPTLLIERSNDVQLMNNEGITPATQTLLAPFSRQTVAPQ